MSSAPDCARTSLVSFLKEGAGAETSAELARHTGTCASCRRELDEALALRGLVARIGAEGMDPRRADEMRFVLMEGTRAPRRSGMKRRALTAAAAIAFVFTGLSGAMALYVAVSEPRAEEEPALTRLKRVVEPARPSREVDHVEREEEEPSPPLPLVEGPELLPEPPVAVTDAPAQVNSRATAPVDPDAAFVDGWRAFRGGRYRRAASIFDRLSRASNIDAARRGEVLYWAARSHEARGARDRAAARYERSLRVAPGGWWRTNARSRLRDLE